MDAFTRALRRFRVGSRVLRIGPGAAPGEGTVEIESRWTARRREQLGVYPVVRRRNVS